MKSVLVLFTILFIFSVNQLAQFPVFVKVIDCLPNKIVSVKGDLNMGAPMENLSWAWKGAEVCFPASQKIKFSGNHVLYSTVISPFTSVVISVIPDHKNSNFSLYAYLLDKDNYSTAPDLKNCLSCEADYYSDKEKTTDGKRTVSLSTNDKPNNLLIGVVGANGLKNGDFVIEISKREIKK